MNPLPAALAALVLSAAPGARVTPVPEPARPSIAPAPGANPYVPQALAQLHDLEEQRALETLERAKGWPGNTPQELARIHLYEGLAYAGLANGTRAVASFHQALLLDPAIGLPEGASPRVRAWWVQALEEAGLKARPKEEPPSGLARSDTPLATGPGVASVALPGAGAEGQGAVAVEGLKTAAAAPPDAHAARWVGGGLIGAGAVALACGIVAGVQASALARGADQEPDISLAVPQRTRAEQRALGANVLYGAAGVLAGGGVLVIVIKGW